MMLSFRPGVPMETDDPYMIGKARTNPFFKLDDGKYAGAIGLGPAKPEMWTNETARSSQAQARPAAEGEGHMAITNYGELNPRSARTCFTSGSWANTTTLPPNLKPPPIAG